jgi:hydrogenase expression/formation protein HypE
MPIPSCSGISCYLFQVDPRPYRVFLPRFGNAYLDRLDDQAVEIQETRIPVSPGVRAACELLGLDPLYVANERKLVAIVGESEAEIVLERMRRHPRGAEVSIIGVVTEKHAKMVVMATGVGGARVVDLHRGEILPRIC